MLAEKVFLIGFLPRLASVCDNRVPVVKTVLKPVCIPPGNM